MQEKRVSKEKGSSFKEIQASGKCTVPLYFCILSSSTPADAEMIEEEDASEPEESNGEHDDRDEGSDVDYDDED